MNDLKLEIEKYSDWKLLRTKKAFLLLPWVAPCYVAIKVSKFLWMYVDDFFETVKFKTTEERQEHIKQFEEEKAMRKSELDMVSIAFILSGIYYLLFGSNSIINVPSEVFLIYIAATINVLGIGKILAFASLVSVLGYGLKYLKGGNKDE